MIDNLNLLNLLRFPIHLGLAAAATCAGMGWTIRRATALSTGA